MGGWVGDSGMQVKMMEVHHGNDKKNGEVKCIKRIVSK